MKQLLKKFRELEGLQGLAQMTLKMQGGSRKRYYKFVEFINRKENQ